MAWWISNPLACTLKQAHLNTEFWLCTIFLHENYITYLIKTKLWAVWGRDVFYHEVRESESWLCFVWVRAESCLLPCMLQGGLGNACYFLCDMDGWELSVKVRVGSCVFLCLWQGWLGALCYLVYDREGWEQSVNLSVTGRVGSCLLREGWELSVSLPVTLKAWELSANRSIRGWDITVYRGRVCVRLGYLLMRLSEKGKYCMLLNPCERKQVTSLLLFVRDGLDCLCSMRIIMVRRFS